MFKFHWPAGDQVNPPVVTTEIVSSGAGNDQADFVAAQQILADHGGRISQFVQAQRHAGGLSTNQIAAARNTHPDLDVHYGNQYGVERIHLRVYPQPGGGSNLLGRHPDLMQDGYLGVAISGLNAKQVTSTITVLLNGTQIATFTATPATPPLPPGVLPPMNVFIITFGKAALKFRSQTFDKQNTHTPLLPKLQPPRKHQGKSPSDTDPKTNDAEVLVMKYLQKQPAYSGTKITIPKDQGLFIYPMTDNFETYIFDTDSTDSKPATAALLVNRVTDLPPGGYTLTITYVHFDDIKTSPLKTNGLNTLTFTGTCNLSPIDNTGLGAECAWWTEFYDRDPKTFRLVKKGWTLIDNSGQATITVNDCHLNLAGSQQLGGGVITPTFNNWVGGGQGSHPVPPIFAGDPSWSPVGPYTIGQNISRTYVIGGVAYTDTAQVDSNEYFVDGIGFNDAAFSTQWSFPVVYKTSDSQTDTFDLSPKAVRTANFAWFLTT